MSWKQEDRGMGQGKLIEGLIEQEEADDREKKEREMEGDNLGSREMLGHWDKELNVEEVVGGGVEKKEEVKGKMEAKEVVDWIEE